MRVRCNVPDDHPVDPGAKDKICSIVSIEPRHKRIEVKFFLQTFYVNDGDYTVVEDFKTDK